MWSYSSAPISIKYKICLHFYILCVSLNLEDILHPYILSTSNRHWLWIYKWSFPTSWTNVTPDMLCCASFTLWNQWCTMVIIHINSKPKLTLILTMTHCNFSSWRLENRAFVFIVISLNISGFTVFQAMIFTTWFIFMFIFNWKWIWRKLSGFNITLCPFKVLEMATVLPWEFWHLNLVVN